MKLNRKSRKSERPSSDVVSESGKGLRGRSSARDLSTDTRASARRRGARRRSRSVCSMLRVSNSDASSTVASLLTKNHVANISLKSERLLHLFSVRTGAIF